MLALGLNRGWGWDWPQLQSQSQSWGAPWKAAYSTPSRNQNATPNTEIGFSAPSLGGLASRMIFYRYGLFSRGIILKFAYLDTAFIVGQVDDS